MSKKRFTLNIPEDIARRALELKKGYFYDKSPAEMYRCLIKLGIDSLSDERETVSEPKSVQPDMPDTTNN